MNLKKLFNFKGDITVGNNYKENVLRMLGPTEALNELLATRDKETIFANVLLAPLSTGDLLSLREQFGRREYPENSAVEKIINLVLKERLNNAQ